MDLAEFVMFINIGAIINLNLCDTYTLPRFTPDKMRPTSVAKQLARLSVETAQARVRAINGTLANHWLVTTSGESSKIEAHYKLKTFKKTWAFLNEVAQAAHEMRHHPTITTTYNRVDISLTTHDVGNHITENDTALAERIQDIYETYAEVKK